MPYNKKTWASRCVWFGVWFGRESSVIIDRRLPVRASGTKLEYDGSDDGSARGSRQRIGLRVCLAFWTLDSHTLTGITRTIAIVLTVILRLPAWRPAAFDRCHFCVRHSGGVFVSPFTNLRRAALFTRYLSPILLRDVLCRDLTLQCICEICSTRTHCLSQWSFYMYCSNASNVFSRMCRGLQGVMSFEQNS